MRWLILSIIALTLGCSSRQTKQVFPENESHLFKIEKGFIYTYNINEEVVDSVKVDNGFSRIVVLSSPMLTYFKTLNTVDKIVGVLNKKRVDGLPKFIKSVGENGLPNIELILSLKPDLILCNTHQLQQIESIDCPKLALDEYLEADPIRRISFLRVVGALTKASKKANVEFSKRVSSLKTYPLKNTKLLKLDHFSGTWYQPGCATYFSKIVSSAGALTLCYNESAKSEVIANETALKLVADCDVLVFHDWHEYEIGWEQRLLPVRNILTKKVKVLYCNTLKSNYFEQSLINSPAIIGDMHQVLSTGKSGVFYKMLQLEP